MSTRQHQVESIIRPKDEKSWSERFREITDRLAKGVERYEQDEIDALLMRQLKR